MQWHQAAFLLALHPCGGNPLPVGAREVKRGWARKIRGIFTRPCSFRLGWPRSGSHAVALPRRARTSVGRTDTCQARRISANGRPRSPL